MLAGLTALLGGGGGGGGSFESIATASGTGSAGTIVFNSIPSTYKSLQLRILARDTTTSSATNNLKIQFNGDTGANYIGYHTLSGNGSAASANGYGATNYAYFLSVIAGSDASNTTTYGTAIVDIIDYTNTSKYKTLRNFGGFDRNGSGYSVLGSAAWMSTSAINSITLTPDSTAYATGSTFALYGIKG